MTRSHTGQPIEDQDRQADTRNNTRKVIIGVLVALAVLVSAWSTALLYIDRTTPAVATPAVAPEPSPTPTPAPKPIKSPYGTTGEFLRLVDGVEFSLPIFGNDRLPDGPLSVSLEAPNKFARVLGWDVHDASGKFIMRVPADVESVTRHYRLVVKATGKHTPSRGKGANAIESIEYTVCPEGLPAGYCPDAAGLAVGPEFIS